MALQSSIYNVQALSSAASQTLDASIANVFTLTLTAATTLAIKNVQPGQAIYIIVTQDGSGSRTLAYNGAGGMTITGPTTTINGTASTVTCLIVVATSYTAATVVGNQQ